MTISLFICIIIVATNKSIGRAGAIILKKPIIAVVLIFVLLFPTISLSASESGLAELIITEIVADNASSDIYEYIEIFNASGKSLDLYNYSIAYSADLTSASYNGPNKKTEIVPGNFSSSHVGLSKAFENPAKFVLPPGGIALVWFWNFDSYAAGANLSDFRAYYDLSDDVMVVAIDADSSSATGNPDRFNLQNSGHRGISIVRDNFVLNAGYEHVICMAPLNYDKIQPSMPDLSVVYGRSTSDSEPWRLNMTAFWIEPTPGYLTDAQKSDFLDAGLSDNSDTASPTSDMIILPIITVFLSLFVLVIAKRKKIHKF